MKNVSNILDTTYILEENDNLILKIQVEPIYRFTYNFYLVKDTENQYNLIYTKMKSSYILNAVKLFKDKLDIKERDISFKEIFDILKDNKEYQTYIKDNYSNKILELNGTKLNGLLYKINSLDFNHKKTELLGADGFSLDFKMDSYRFYSWCFYSDKYFEPIFELTNYFLDLADIDRDWRFYAKS